MLMAIAHALRIRKHYSTGASNHSSTAGHVASQKSGRDQFFSAFPKLTSSPDARDMRRLMNAFSRLCHDSSVKPTCDARAISYTMLVDSGWLLHEIFLTTVSSQSTRH